MKKLILLLPALAICLTIGAQTGAIFPPRFPHVAAPNSGISSLTLSKTSNVSTYNAVGNLITYTYTIHNTGTLSLAGPIRINDNVQGVIVSCGTTPLAVNATTSCTSNHPSTQADLDNGSIVNTATATDTASGAVSAQSTVTVTAIQSPAISLSKVPNPTSFTTVPTTITYTYTVTNTGNVTLTGNVSISDNLTGNIPICQNVAPLPPLGNKQCTSQFTANTIAPVTNTATASVTYNGNAKTSTASATVTNGAPLISVTAPGNGLTPALCNGTNDDQPAIQAILNFAANTGISGIGPASAATPYTITVPSGVTCAMKSWFSISQGSRNLTIPSYVTLETAPGFTSQATILQVGDCPAGQMNGCGGRMDLASIGGFAVSQVIGIGNDGQNATQATAHNVSSGPAGSSVLTMSNSGDSSAFFHVNDDIYIYDQLPSRTFPVSSVTWSGNTASFVVNGTMPVNNGMYTNELVGYNCGSGNSNNGCPANMPGFTFQPTYSLQAGYTTTTATATFATAGTNCSGSGCGGFVICLNCDVQYAQENKVTGIDLPADGGAGHLHLLNPILKAFPWQGRQAVVMNVQGILSDQAGVHDLTIKGASPIGVNQTYAADIRRNNFIVDATVNNGVCSGCNYIVTYIIESQFNTTWDSNAFTVTNTGTIGYNFEFLQRNSSYNTIHANQFSSSTGGHNCMGEGESGGGNVYNGNTYWLWVPVNGCGANGLVIAGVNDQFINNSVNVPASFLVNGSGSQAFIFVDGDTPPNNSEGDNYFTCCISNLTFTGNTFNNCVTTNDGSASGYGNSACVLLIAPKTTYSGNTVNRNGTTITGFSVSGTGDVNGGGNVVN